MAEKLSDYTVPSNQARVEFPEAWFGKDEDEQEAALYTAEGVQYAIYNKKVSGRWKERQDAYSLFSTSVEAADNDGGDDEGLVLLCDQCDNPHHAHCVGFEGTLQGDWLCPSCEDA